MNTLLFIVQAGSVAAAGLWTAVSCGLAASRPDGAVSNAPAIFRDIPDCFVGYARRTMADHGVAVGPHSRIARWIACVTGIVAAIFALTGLVAPVVAYSALCLSLVVVYLGDLYLEERSRRQRVASLTPRRPLDFVMATWVVTVSLSILLLIPYFLDGATRGAAFIVALSAIAMACVAWRIASAPTQLAGVDLPVERIIDRGTRAARTGMTTVLAVGLVFAFTSFANTHPGTMTNTQFTLFLIALAMWAGLWWWQIRYVRQVFGSLDAIAR